MATIVGAALLSASVKLLMQKIVFPQFVDFYRSMKLDVPLLEKLKITLVSLEAVLNDAEEKQITNLAVKEWLNMLHDAVFEADHLLDEINTEALRCKVEADQVLKKLFSHRFNRKIYSKLKKLFKRLEHLRNQNLGLKEVVSDSVWHGTPTSSVVGDESAIYGRDDDKKKLKEFLMSEDGSDGGSKVGVVSIVEGLVPQPENEERWEKVAEEYFNELVSSEYFSNPTIVMPFSPSLRFRKGVTNFPKICLCCQNLSTFEECIRLGIKTLPNVWAGKADGL
ncbi:hypothetical protein P8452_24521 [Trifolium repens]|nr:hypothetical protein P8452_24521 [Trifolium repens]